MGHNQDGLTYLSPSWPVETHPTDIPWETIMEDWRFLSSNAFPSLPAHAGFVRQTAWANVPHPALSYANYVPPSLQPRAPNVLRKSHHRSLGRHLASHHTRPLPSSWRTPHQPSRRPVQRPRPLYRSVTLNPVRLSRKPRDWRGSYRSSSKGGLRRYFSRIGSIIPRGPGYAALRQRLVLNSIISYRSFVSYDLRIHPTLQPHPLDAVDLNQIASSPPDFQFVLWHRKLPWYINVQSSHAGGITIQDLFTGIYEELGRPIGYHEYYTAELTSEDRATLDMAFQTRCCGNKDEIRRGVRRIDFLGQECSFAGIARSRNGTWELKTVPFVPPRMIID